MSAEDDPVWLDPPRLSDEILGPFAALVRAGRAYRPPLGLRKTRRLPIPAEPGSREPAEPRSSKPPSSSSGGQ